MWPSGQVKLSTHEDCANRSLRGRLPPSWLREDDAQSHYSEMMGFMERSLEVLFQTQTSKNRTLQKEEIHVNVSPEGGPEGGREGGRGRGRLVIIFKWPRGFRANLPYLAGGVTLLYERPIFQPSPPHNYCTVSNFRFHFYAFFVSLLGTNLFFFFLLVCKVPHFSSLSMSEKLPGCSIVMLRSKRAGLFKLELVKLIYFIT